MTVDLDKHNERRDKIIAHEKATHGVADVDTGRLMRGKLEDVTIGVAGYGAWLEERRDYWKALAEKLAVENEELIDKNERLEAVR